MIRSHDLDSDSFVGFGIGMPRKTPSTRRLISEPFGPYPEYLILNDGLGKKGQCLDLKSVSMECAGSPIGFGSQHFDI